MNHEIPDVIEDIYLATCPGPNPDFWPEWLKDDPVRGYGLWTFYQGLQMGLQLGEACLQEH